MCLNAEELEFPHQPPPWMHYVGPMVAEHRVETMVSEETHQALDQLFERCKQQNKALIYCGCSSFREGSEQFLREAIAAVTEVERWELIVGLGNRLKPAQLEPLPENVSVFDWTPQLKVLARADCAMINSGPHSIAECIHFGVPMLVYSRGHACQNGSAARVAYHRLGIVGDLEKDQSGDIRQALQRLLNESIYRQRVIAMQARTRRYQDNAIAAQTVVSLVVSLLQCSLSTAQGNKTVEKKHIAGENKMMPARSCYMVCSTVRSGSTLLCKTLAQFDGYGQPEEYFHRHIIRQQRLNQSSKAFVDYCHAIYKQHLEEDGAFGIKMHWQQLDDFLRMARHALSINSAMARSDREVIETFFPGIQFVYLQREDRVAQAVSAAIAAQTGCWEKSDKSSDRSKSPPSTVKFQPWKIYEWETALTEQNQRWQTFFQQNNIIPYQLTYEQLTVAFSETVCQVTKHIGHTVDGFSNSLTADGLTIPVQRQANFNNQRLIQGYRLVPRPVSAALRWLYRRLKPLNAKVLPISSPREEAV